METALEGATPEDENEGRVGVEKVVRGVAPPAGLMVVVPLNLMSVFLKEPLV